MTQSPDQRLLIEGMESLRDARRTPEFESLLLSFFDEKHRPFLQEILSLKPAFSRSELREALAAKSVMERRGEFANDDDCIAAVADHLGMSAETVRLAAKGKRPPVNAILRRWGLKK